MLGWIFLIIINIVAWYPTLSFWFFQAWEQGWLIGNCGYSFNLYCIMQGHALLYWFNYTLFKWNPSGWYLTTLILHTAAVLLVQQFVNKLTKNKTAGFVSAMIFAVNITYHDVLTWGSFNGLYALMLLLFLTASLCYIKFMEEKNKSRFLWYSAILFIFIVCLLVRESALLLPFFLLAIEIFSKNASFSKKRIVTIIIRFIPIFTIFVAYLLYKKLYGAASYDYIDGSVQYRISLLTQGQYLEYIKRTLLMVGLFSAPHIIPFQFLNFLRDFITLRFTSPRIMYYFFPVIGFLYIALQLFFIGKSWKNKKIRNILIISFIWFLLPAIFACLVITYSDDTMIRPYSYNVPPRYRYFSFFGTSLFWTTVFIQFYGYLTQKYKKYRKYITYIFFGILIGNLLLNLFLLRGIENNMYETLYKPEKDFYKKFTSIYKTLPKSYLFYVYPQSGPLKDFLAEWHHIRKVYYPYLVEERGTTWEENHIGMLLERLEERNGNLNETFFVDYTTKLGLIDRTREGREILGNLTDFTYNIQNEIDTVDKEEKNVFLLSLNPKLHVEIPYKIIISLSARENVQTKQDIPYEADKLEKLVAYTRDRIDFQKNTKVSVCGTAPMGGVVGRFAMFLDPRNLTDGNLGRKSLWVSDCRPAWILFDLGKEKEIAGIAFHTMSPSDVSSSYTIEVSEDNINWKKVTTVNGNTNKQQIITFDPVLTRYVRFTTLQTVQGSAASFDEVEVLDKDAAQIASYYGNNVEQLLKDSYQYGGAPFVKLSWETSPNTSNDVSENTMYLPVDADSSLHDYTFEPNENEHFSLENGLFRRYINSFTISLVGSPVIGQMYEVRIIPLFSLPVQKGDQEK